MGPICGCVVDVVVKPVDVVNVVIDIVEFLQHVLKLDLKPSLEIPGTCD